MKIKEIINELPEPVYLVDKDHRIRFFNKKAEELTGLSFLSIEGKEFSKDIIKYKDTELYQYPVINCLQTGMEVRKSLILITVDGDKFVEEWCKPVKKGDKIKGAISIIKDLGTAFTQFEKIIQERKKQKLIGVCAWCKKIKLDEKSWEPLERYLGELTLGTITHGICPQCAEKIFEKRVYLESYQNICKSISSSLSLNEVLNHIVTNLVKVMKVRACMVRLLNKETGELEVKASYGLSERYIKKGPVELDPVIRDTLSGKVISIYDITKDEKARYRKEAEEEGIRSIISIPLKCGNEILGVLRLYTDEPVQYTDEDLRFITAIAEQAAIAITNARVFEFSLTKAKEYLHVFEEVTKAVTSSLNLEDVLNTIVTKLPDVMKLKAATIRLLDETGKKLRLVAHYGLSKKYLERGPVDLEENIREALQAKPVAIFDVVNDPRVKYQKEAEEEGIKSMLTLPIISRGDVIGILRLLSDTPRRFNDEEIRFTTSLAEVCGIAIENARMYQKRRL